MSHHDKRRRKKKDERKKDKREGGRGGRKVVWLSAAEVENLVPCVFEESVWLLQRTTNGVEEERSFPVAEVSHHSMVIANAYLDSLSSNVPHLFHPAHHNNLLKGSGFRVLLLFQHSAREAAPHVIGKRRYCWEVVH